MNKLIVLAISLFFMIGCAKKSENRIMKEEKNVPFVWNGANLYFLLTDRFNNGDTTNDLNFGRTKETAKLRGFKGGDIKGITQKIYEGYFTDGRLFDSSRKDLEENYGMYNPKKDEGGYYGPMTMKIGPDVPMIAGFKEGIAAMRVGDEAYLYIPSHLAYGENGRGNIKPNTDLIFIIEMIEIE